jgi:hypothetical protein
MEWSSVSRAHSKEEFKFTGGVESMSDDELRAIVEGRFTEGSGSSEGTKLS